MCFKLRVNSKASYLPRQTRDKFNNADPDHGSYKLTLTSNEDSIISQHSTITPIKHISYQEEILPPKPKCNNNNLPDVLLVGVKLQQSSPTSNTPSPKYGINNNNNIGNLPNTNNSPTTPTPTTPNGQTVLYPHGYPCNMKVIMSQTNSPSQINHQSQQQLQRLNRSPATTPSTPPPPYSSMTSLNQRSNQNSCYNSPTQLNDQSSPKYMSQSTIDLKRTQFLDSKESVNKFNDGILSPAQSENNISHQLVSTPTNLNESSQLNSFTSIKQRDFQRTDIIRKLSLEEHHDPGEGRIVRAELVNTTLSISPPISKSEEKISIKRESLRENIEKITQLQSKLMSAHTMDNICGDRKILGYTTKNLKLEATQSSLNQDNSKILKQIECKQSCLPESPIKITSPVQFTCSSPNISMNKNLNTSSDCKQKALPKMENSSTEVSTTTENQLIQRTEIILRVNPPTTETASQTDETLQTSSTDNQLALGNESNSNNFTYQKSIDRISTPSPTLMPRRKLSEEIDCDILSQKLASLLPSSEDKLSQILTPSTYKSTADYVINLYNPNVAPRPAKRDAATSTPSEKFFDIDKLDNIKDKSFSIDCNGQDYSKLNGTVNGETSLCDLTKKKEELINRLTKKLDVLTKEQYSIKEETQSNDQLGSNIATKIADKVRPIDVTKFKAYIDDVGHITMLLLSLSGRLAKIENTLHGINENSTEKKTLESKRDRLTEQLEEAKKLKEDIDRRGSIVYKIIERNLTNDDCADYEYFINMKAKLIIDLREIDDKMKLGEEQLKALKETLQIQSEC
ncbi:protein Shroom-like [Condylostylus longicornis]|uniref:protein Shroom-like n=1 Tax=Condylostylus longicornis TaxID=2530218 RepID=UPI00244E111A|nr:protein Shroom-like [Condylostylus longicornis]